MTQPGSLRKGCFALRVALLAMALPLAVPAAASEAAIVAERSWGRCLEASPAVAVDRPPCWTTVMFHGRSGRLGSVFLAGGRNVGSVTLSGSVTVGGDRVTLRVIMIRDGGGQGWRAVSGLCTVALERGLRPRVASFRCEWQAPGDSEAWVVSFAGGAADP